MKQILPAFVAIWAVLPTSCRSSENPPAPPAAAPSVSVATPAAVSSVAEEPCAEPCASAVPSAKTQCQEECQRNLKELGEAAILMAACSSKADSASCKAIASYTTTYLYEGKKYSKRAHNIALVAEKLNRNIIMPRERFSFNKTVGERTEEHGFEMAPIYFAGLKTEGMGGGTCQVSSTVYAAAMLAHMRIIQRTAHTRPSSYIPKGMDATVDYGTLDLIIENPYDFPVYLEVLTEKLDKDNPTKKTLGVWFLALKDSAPKFEVKHSWYGYKPLPFETRYIDSIYHRGPPKQEQSGKEGEPGRRLWIYLDETGKKFDSVRVVSRYKPVDEIWMQNPNYEPPEETVDAGLTAQL